MISLEDRRGIARMVEQPYRDGARRRPACAIAGIDTRTLQLWKSGEGPQRGDARPQAVRPVPAHALSPEERAQILQAANEQRSAELPPARIVPMLADEGVYIASELSFSRVLRAHGVIAGAPKRPDPYVRRARTWPPALGRCGVGM